MSESYIWTASPVERGGAFVGILVFTEVHRRILKGEFGRIPKHISDDAFASGGYCLDAPEAIPAGGCEYFRCDEETGLPAQLQISREDLS
jgi:hypothetical protein